MANSNTRSPRSQHMDEVHALGHPELAPPQTGWGKPGVAAIGGARATVLPPPTTSPPNAPAAPGLAQGTGSNLLVTWVAPGVDGTHSAATAFGVRWSPSAANTWTTIAGVSSPYNLSGLPAGTAIDVQIQASNSAGVSPWSGSRTLTTASTGPYAPNAPSISSVAAPPDGSNSKLVVVWSAPAVDGTHGAATGYNLRTSPHGANTWTTVSAVSSPYTVTGQSGGASIDVQVQATNAAASPSAWSATIAATTWGATVTPGGWQPAATQVHGTSVAPNGGVQMFAVPAPTSVTSASFAWSSSNTVVPTSGLISAPSDGQTNGWGNWFNAPATAGTYYLWSLAQGAGGTIGALVGSVITVT